MVQIHSPRPFPSEIRVPLIHRWACPYSCSSDSLQNRQRVRHPPLFVLDLRKIWCGNIRLGSDSRVGVDPFPSKNGSRGSTIRETKITAAGQSPHPSKNEECGTLNSRSKAGPPAIFLNALHSTPDY